LIIIEGKVLLEKGISCSSNNNNKKKEEEAFVTKSFLTLAITITS
jgi:hypothetical protein